MNILVAQQSHLGDINISMTSTQIADLCNKRHDNVKRTIESLINQGVIAQPQIEVMLNELNNRIYETENYVFKGKQGRLDSITIVAQLDAKFTAALVTRWDELENQIAKPALPDFNNPSDAARAWADEYDAKQALQIELQQAQPKITHYDTVVDRTNLLSATQVALKLGMSAITLNRHLTDLGVYNKSVKRGKVFAKWFIDAGYAEMKQTATGFDQPLFTHKGEAWVIEQMIGEGVA